MALKITCPHCGTIRRLSQPYPLPGTELSCDGCGRGLAISYPPAMINQMRAKGVTFYDPFSDTPVPAESSAAETSAAESSTANNPQPKSPGLVGAGQADATAPLAVPLRDAATSPLPAPAPVLAPAPAPVPMLRRPAPDEDRTVVERFGQGPSDRTEQVRARSPAVSSPSVSSQAASARPALEDTAAFVPRPPRVRSSEVRPTSPPLTPPLPPSLGARTPSPPKPPRKRRSFFWRALRAGVLLTLVCGLAGAVAVVMVVRHYSEDLPTVQTLATYQPPTVTVVRDSKGELLGEIYEKRRYVVSLDEIPEHVQDAFIAAEDANFWSHGGIDYGGILRAVGRNAAQGKKAQGASTITQQVARTFLLSSEKTYERKIREVLLAQRIEEVFDKQHILYLYLNQIYLGSGAYGVEAASRVYFNKSVGEITLAEAAILAGLPQRPSDYSPHQHWEKARARQEYVLGQLRDKGFVDQAAYDQAMAEVVEIAPKTNDFLTQAPYFTEYIRRYLVDTYGFDKIYNDGLTVYASCDLALQRVAQQAVVDNVLRASNSIGWRGATETVAEAQIQTRLDAQELSLRKAQSQQTLRVAAIDNPLAGPGEMPAHASLLPGQRYAGVVLSTEKDRIIVGVGTQQVLVPLIWSKWMYKPNPERSYRSRVQRDLRTAVSRGDAVTVSVDAASVAEVKELSSYAKDDGELVAGRIYQAPEIEGSMLSYRQSDGAVQAMVGGYDFSRSEFNRATQAMRQVGSTFKPIVYTAAIATKKFTTGTLVQDAPTVFGVLGYGLYKPGNYGETYLGNITLRRALQLSRNVVTVRILDKIGLEPVFQMAGPTLGIGYDKPQCSRIYVPADSECDGTLSPSPVAGMAWCESCDPDSCSMIRVKNVDSCLTQPESRNDELWCRSCDVSLRTCSWVSQTRLSRNEECLDERLDPQSGEIICRACDLSMGLGSSSLTMLELARAYSAFATYGTLVEPHFIESVVDRDGTVIEAYIRTEPWPRVLNSSVAGIGHWLLHEVATGGTGAHTNRLGIHVAGKTGTTNDFKDAWFVGYNTQIVTAAWVGYDQPRSLGVSFTGGSTALPIWMDYMRVAAPKEDDKPFPPIPNVDMVQIDEATGRVAHGGRTMPMLRGTAPTNVVGEVGQKTAEDLLTSDF